MYNQAFVVCEKIKERLCSQDDYQSFLKFLDMFSNGIFQKKELLDCVGLQIAFGLIDSRFFLNSTLFFIQVSRLLEKFPDLMEEFSQFFERCESIGI